MTDDNTKRLAMFAEHQVELRRLALNYDQVERYHPPPNPAKETDSRHDAYVSRFGHSSWELDALEPTVIHNLIVTEIRHLIDLQLFRHHQEIEQAGKTLLKTMANRWEDVQGFLRGREKC